MKRLTSDEKRAQELRAAVSSIGTSTKAPMKFALPDLRRMPEVTQADLMQLKREILAEMKSDEVSEMTPETAKALIAAMKKLPEQDRLEVQDIRNHQAFIFAGQKYGTHELMHGGSAASTQSVTYVYNEVVAGSGTAFTLAHVPTSGSVALYGNGQRLTVGIDYTISGITITIIAPATYSTGAVLADYTY